MVFPSEDTGDRTPVDFVSKGDDVIGGIECKYVWIGPKGWGVTWALKQCAVKPKEMESTEGLLQLDLGQSFDSPAPVVKRAPAAAAVPKVQETVEESTAEEKEEKVEMKENPIAETPKQENFVEDSDQEEEEKEEEQEEKEPEPEPEPVKKVVKKSVVKKAAPAKEEQPEPEAEAEPEATAPKKVVKKVVRKKA